MFLYIYSSFILHCELLVPMGRIWSKKFSYLEVTLEGTEKDRAGGEGPVGGAGDPRDVAQKVLRGVARTRRTTARGLPRAKRRVRARAKKKKVVGSGVDVR